jgi:cation:H+ antiporter
VLQATKHETLELFGEVMGYFVLPLTAITLLVFFSREVRIHRARARQAADPGRPS